MQHPPTILNVNDDDAGRYVTTRTLEQAGFRVREAATGVAAFELLTEGPDLIVLDVQLPDISGAEVCRRIRQRPESQRIPVLHLSATFARNEHVVAGLESGADGYLVQPVDPAVLVATIHSLLRSRRSEQELRESEERFRVTFDEATVGIAHFAPDGAWLRFNRRLCEIVGYSSDELLRRSFEAVTHPDDREALDEYVRRVLSGEIRTFSMEMRCLSKGEGAVWIHLKVSLVRRPGGDPAYFIAVIEDIRHQKANQAALRQRNARLRLRAEQLRGLADAALAVSAASTVEEVLRLVTERSREIVGAERAETRATLAETPEQIAVCPSDAPAGTLPPAPGLTAPVIGRDGECLGLIQLWAKPEGEFTEEDQSILVQLAQMAAHALEIRLHQGQLEERVRARTAALERLNTELRGQVTERARAQEALRANHALLRAVVEGTPDAVYAKDLHGRYLLANSAAAALAGRAVKQMLGRDDFRIFSAEAAEKRRLRDLRVVASGEAEIYEDQEEVGGVARTFRSVKSPLRDADGEVIGLVGVRHDISELKRAEAALREEKSLVQLLQTMADAANEASTLEEAVQVCLDEVCAHTGWPVGHACLPNSAGELVSTPLWHLERAEEYGFFRQITEAMRWSPGVGLPGRVLAEGKPAWITDVRESGEFIRRVPPEANGVVAAFAFPILVGAEVVGVLEFFTSEPTEPNPALLKALERIGVQLGRVVERARAEERLRDYSARLEQSNRELQDFATIASHDLQEPLRKIQAFADLLRAECAGALSEDGQEYLAEMRSGAGRLQRLIQDLLTLSRVTTRGQPLRRVDLGEVAREVLADLEVRVEESGARVEVGELPALEADPTQMRQLLQNLIGNALKFHRPGQAPVVRVCSEQLVGSTECLRLHAVPDWCRITVSDNGIGFDPKYAERIFAPFQRLHGRSQYEGTGMGLAICRRIAERHGGSISVESAPGEGATFTVTLPLRQGRGGAARG